MIRKFQIAILVALIGTAATVSAQDVASFEKRVTVHKLKNGLTLVILERHEAPVFSQRPHRFGAHDGA